MPAPTTEERRKCHQTRDAYFKCVDENGSESALCKEAKALYDKSCPASWVKYFARKRAYDTYKAKLNTEGFKLEDEAK
ncbi:predicted protein [Nematostella vectensis]|nr:predicted protein [Nematostella vectensis]|eukprot:XP_001621017.1 hypothetical protein NEMVEDRAFT_v1g146311 [Nematostella vectensis]